MKVICSWCQSESRPALEREKPPLADVRETHGICHFHLQQIGVSRDPLVPCGDGVTRSRHEAVLMRRISPAAIAW
jgi:hypothetical protein